jgi:MYXO-CTERM domain-containing protein
MRFTRWLALALTVCWSPTATAQIKPKILILFDTSGSMLQSSASVWQPGDGSALCTGDGKQSRIYQLKAALFDTLQGMGALEVDFGLATFPMFVDPTRTPYCPIGKLTCQTDADCRPNENCQQVYTTVTCNTNADCQPGHQCVNVFGVKICRGNVCISPCQTTPSCSAHYYTGSALISENPGNPKCPQGYGCKVSTHSPATQQDANCGAASNPCAPWYTEMRTEVLKVPFAGTTPEKVMIYFDQLEDTNTVAPLQNPEVRAGDGWCTPLGKSLFYAHGYFHKEVVPTIAAYEKPCTSLAVALFTDGSETCNDATSNAFYPTKWAQNLVNNLGVVTHTVAIDTQSTMLQAIATAGKGGYYQVAGNTAALKQAFLDIIAKSLPPTEICNGKDDDCDNKVDEDFPQKGQPCDNGKLGVCFKTGVYVCSSDGSGVVCNAPDATGTPEVCNGLDDDCDGDIDDIPGCIPCVPQPEVCNGKDDNCNGQVDEGYVSVPCGKDIGECKPGNTKCVNGKVICDGGTGAQNEKCNGLDDDCDGVRDGMTDSCYTFPTGCTQDPATGQWTCTGFCKPGMMTCVATQVGGAWQGVWSNCIGEVGPAKEVCNGLDDDCDGSVDEDAECPGGSQCINGQCTSPCGTGEFICPKGQLCKDGWCVKDPCDAATCEGKGWVCKGGECIDPCKNATCGKYETCVRGACVDTSCFNPQNKCPEGEICVEGQCVADACAGKTDCGDDEYCKGGHCVKICDTITCGPGELCKLTDEDGKPVARCVKDACADKTCSDGWVCVDGKCVVDPCNTTRCETGEVCVGDGECVPDPCLDVKCPPRFTCDEGMCVTNNVESTREILASGSGGLACSVSTSGGSPGHLLLLIFGVALLIMIRRRNPANTSWRDEA